MSDLPKWLKVYLDRALVDEEGIWTYEDIPTDWGYLIMYGIYEKLSPEIQTEGDCELIDGILREIGPTIVGNAIERLLEDTRKEFRKTKNEKCSICEQKVIEDTILHICSLCLTTYQAEAQKVKVHLYRAKKAKVPATLTLVEWLTTLKRFEYKCAYCQERPYEILEHYIPIPTKQNGDVITQGGTTVNNCVPACRSCNSQKGGKQP